MSVVEIIVLADCPAWFPENEDGSTSGTHAEVIATGPGEALGRAVFERLLKLEREIEAHGGYWIDWVPSHDALPAFIGAAKLVAGANLAARQLIIRAQRARDYISRTAGGLDVWTPMPWLDGKSVHDVERELGQWLVDEATRDREYAERRLAIRYGEVR